MHHVNEAGLYEALRNVRSNAGLAAALNSLIGPSDLEPVGRSP
jgi:hypothetical protein